MSGPFRLDDYLARIGLRGPLPPTHATLAAVQAAHVDAIPFENLDPLLRRPVDLDLDRLQAKLVDDRRGGYCFEQNALLGAALDALGFTVIRLIARVLWMAPPDAPLGPKTHMLLKVDCPEAPFLVDAGFGGCVIDTPLRFKTDVDQPTAMGAYRLTRSGHAVVVSGKQAEGWRPMYVFDSEPALASDYDLGNWFTSTSPLTPFLANLIMERVGTDKRYKIVNRTFLVEDREGVLASSRAIESADDLRRILAEVFRVTPPVPAEDILARIGL